MLNDYLLKQCIKTKTIDGFHMNVFKKDTVVSKAIAKFGYWEPDVRDFIINYIKPGMRVLELGGNVGYHTLVLADCIGSTGIVYCFECNSDFAAVIQENIVINNFSKRVQVIAKGAYSEPIVLPYAKHKKNFGGSSIVKPGQDRSNVPAEYDIQEGIECVRVDDIIQDKIDFIKMDIEGCEYPAMQGMIRMLTNFNPDIVFEVSAATSAEQYQMLHNLGYHFFTLTGQKFNSQEDFLQYCHKNQFHDVLCSVKKNFFS